MTRTSGWGNRIGASLACALAITAIAAIPRWIGLDLGGVFAASHPDEAPVLEAHARRIEPSWYVIAYGGGYHVPLHFAMEALAGVGFATPLDLGPGAAPQQRQERLLPLRGFSAALSTAAVALVFAAGRAAAGTAGGAIAALVVAAAPTAIRDAHIAKADAAATFAAALVIASLAIPWKRRTMLPISLGVSFGLALSTKYMVGLAPAVLLALWRPATGEPTGGWRRLLLFGATGAATLLALNWFWVTDPGKCWRLWTGVLESQYAYVHHPWLRDSIPNTFAYHAVVSLGYGCGWLTAIATAPAVVAALARPGALRWISVAVVGQLAVLFANPFVISRNLSPIVPGIAIAIGWLVTALVGRAKQEYRAPIWALAAALLVAPPGADGLRMALAMRETDTRGLASEWIALHVPSDAALVGWGGPARFPWGMPDVAPHKLYLGIAPHRWRDFAGFAVRYHYPTPWASQPLPDDAGLGAPLVVFDPFRAGADPIVEPLDAFYLPLAQFSGVERMGPRIEIYSLAGGSALQR